MSPERRKRGIGRIAKASIGLAILASPLASAIAEEAINGARDYRNYCAVCHGAGGQGDGPMASNLTRRPSDLTILSKTNGGSFPETVVYKIIDGRRVVLFHGTSEMPIWGNRFRNHSNAVSADARIGALVSYVERIQAK